MKKTVLLLGAAVVICVLVIVLTRDSDWALRAGLGIMAGGIFLWVTEPIPMPLTALLIIAALAASGAVSLDTALSGFSANSLFLIVAGFMIARGLNETPLIRRLTYSLLVRFGGTPRRSLLVILVILQIMAFFIPSIAVKVTMLLPAVYSITQSLPAGRSNIKTALLLGLAFGVSITSFGLLPAAIANVIAADLIGKFSGFQVTYLDWMIYNLPLSLLLIPVTWKILLWVFPPEVEHFPGGVEQLKRTLQELGPFSSGEKRCTLILLVTIILWLTEPLHGMHSAVPALIAAILLAFPGIGVTEWDKMVIIDWGTVIMAATTISLGTVLMVTGASAFLADLFFPTALAEYIFTTPIIAIVFLAVFIQLYHMIIGNVATVVVSMLPIVLELTAHRAGAPALALGFTISISALAGFVLVIQTMPNVIIYGTGLIKQQELLKAGLLLTVTVIAGIWLMAATWWPLLGLL